MVHFPPPANPDNFSSILLSAGYSCDSVPGGSCPLRSASGGTLRPIDDPAPSASELVNATLEVGSVGPCASELFVRHVSNPDERAHQAADCDCRPLRLELDAREMGCL